MHVQPRYSVSHAPLVTARAAASAPVRTALRTATHAIHMRMHSLEPFEAILEGRLSLNGYLSLIQSLLVYHSSIAAGAALYGCESLSSGGARLALLRADFQALGGSAPEGLADWQPCTHEEALGGLYTAEGSMLGGRIIAGQLDYLFGTASVGRSFFIGSPADGAHWRKLLRELEARCAAPDEFRRAVGGAQSSFALFEQCVGASTTRPSISVRGLRKLTVVT